MTQADDSISKATMRTEDLIDDDETLPEGVLLKRLMIEGSQLGLRLFRNQTGTYQLKDGRYLTSGLCVGSSDLIGYLPVTITPAMVGRRIAVFVAVEVKGPRRRVTAKQSMFLEALAHAGAITALVHSVRGLVSAVSAWRTK